jgi:hypothetical protein
MPPTMRPIRPRVEDMHCPNQLAANQLGFSLVEFMGLLLRGCLRR